MYNRPCEENHPSAHTLQVVAELEEDEMIVRYYCTGSVGRAGEQLGKN